MPQRPLRIGWFTAGRGLGSRGMFEHTVQAIQNGSLNARLEFVFMHRERGEGEGSDAFMDRAAELDIPVAALSAARFREQRGGKFAEHRGAYDQQVLGLLDSYAPDICVLAGYLLIMSPLLTHAFPCVNLHPALPDGPIGLWQKVIWELIDSRAEESGLMTFLVTDDLDKGPPISYARFSLRGPRFDSLWSGVGGRDAQSLREVEGEEHPLFAAIRREGLRREPLLVLETLKAFAGGDVSVSDRAIRGREGAPLAPRDLTGQVDAALVAEG